MPLQTGALARPYLLYLIILLVVSFPCKAFAGAASAFPEPPRQSISEDVENQLSLTAVNHSVQEYSDHDLASEFPVPAILASPGLPMKLRPTGIPVVRPERKSKRTAHTDGTQLLGSLPDLIIKKEPARPPKLLPEQESNPGIVYIMPFLSVMVPDQVYDHVFDQFVDTMIDKSDLLGLQFVIIKEGLNSVDAAWLAGRNYITGELYAYVEDSGCCSTDIRSRARITYHRSNQATPAFDYVFPVSTFFDHDQSSLDAEREKLAENIATTFAEGLLDTLAASSTNERTQISLSMVQER